MLFEQQDKMKNADDLFGMLLEFVGFSAQGESERRQAFFLLGFCTLFGGVAGLLTDGLASTLWFGLAGVCTVLLVIAVFWTTD